MAKKQETILRPSDVYPGVTRQEAVRFTARRGYPIIGFREVKCGEHYLSSWYETKIGETCPGGFDNLAVYSYGRQRGSYKPAGPRCILGEYDEALEREAEQNEDLDNEED